MATGERTEATRTTSLSLSLSFSLSLSLSLPLSPAHVAQRPLSLAFQCSDKPKFCRTLREHGNRGPSLPQCPGHAETMVPTYCRLFLPNAALVCAHTRESAALQTHVACNGSANALPCPIVVPCMEPGAGCASTLLYALRKRCVASVATGRGEAGERSGWCRRVSGGAQRGVWPWATKADIHANLCTRPLDAEEPVKGHGHSARQSQPRPRGSRRNALRVNAMYGRFPVKVKLPGHGVKDLWKQQQRILPFLLICATCKALCIHLLRSQTLYTNEASGVKRSQIHDLVLVVKQRSPSSCRPSWGAGVNGHRFVCGCLGTICQVLQFLWWLSPCCSACKRR